MYLIALTGSGEPASWEKVDRIPSFAMNPTSRAKAYLQSPKPAKLSMGVRALPSMKAKLWDGSSTYPDGPILRISHVRELMKSIINPAFFRKWITLALEYHQITLKLGL